MNNLNETGHSDKQIMTLESVKRVVKKELIVHELHINTSQTTSMDCCVANDRAREEFAVSCQTTRAVLDASVAIASSWSWVVSIKHGLQ